MIHSPGLRWRTRERGAALLEVLAAVVILGVAGIGFVELVGAGTRAVAAARLRERELADVERLLAAYTLLARGDLDRRLGRRAVGPYIMEVQRLERTLYRIALARKQAADIEDLVTVVFRPESTGAP
ncbi:MAG: type IV pilus modification PilV family protein [Gemmatimonadales bacterium]